MSHSKVTRIGIIGDVHGRPDLLRRALEALRSEQVHAIGCVGDIVGAARDTDDVCQLLAESNVFVVKGNHDRWLLEKDAVRHDASSLIARSSIAFLEALPPYRLLETLAGTVMICHGFAGNDLGVLPKSFPEAFVRRALRLGSLPLDCVAVFFGHAHVRRIEDCEGILFVGVGTLAAEADAGCVVFDSATRAVSFISY